MIGNGNIVLGEFLAHIRRLVEAGDVRISEYGYDELAEDGLTVKALIEGVSDAVLVEEYPTFPKGPSALLLQKDQNGRLVHVVWGIPKGYDKPAVLITAYCPDPARWDEDFLRRRSRCDD